MILLLYLKKKARQETAVIKEGEIIGKATKHRVVVLVHDTEFRLFIITTTYMLN